MMKPCFAFAIGCFALLFSGCGRNDVKDLKNVKITPSAKVEMTEVWLKVDGMSQRLGIT